MAEKCTPCTLTETANCMYCDRGEQDDNVHMAGFQLCLLCGAGWIAWCDDCWHDHEDRNLARRLCWECLYSAWEEKRRIDWL
jgi:hypothetical protein